MLVLLGTLIAIYLRLDIGRTAVSAAQRWCVNALFSVYLGWITVATIANVTDVLYYYHWDGFGVSALAWTLLLLGVGVALAGISAATRRDAAYLLVLVWAFAGISMRFLEMPVLNAAGFTAAALVLVILIASRLPGVRRTSAPMTV